MCTCEGSTGLLGEKQSFPWLFMSLTEKQVPLELLWLVGQQQLLRSSCCNGGWRACLSHSESFTALCVLSLLPPGS